MSASKSGGWVGGWVGGPNMIRKRCLRCATVEECTSKVDFSVYKCKKVVVVHLGTNNKATDDSPKTIASKLAEEGKAYQRSTQTPKK